MKISQEIRDAIKSWVSTVLGILFLIGGGFQMLKVFYIGEMDIEIMFHGLIFLFLGFFLIGAKDEELIAIFRRIIDNLLTKRGGDA